MDELIPIKFAEWKTPKQILVILAHPDDPEFFLGGTIAQWSAAGHDVSYLLLTRGEKGISEQYPGGESLKKIREKEQQEAAAKLGVTQIDFLNYPDGYLEVNLTNRKRLVAEIRKKKPDIVVSCDPQAIFFDSYINHPDHRAAGQLTIDAVFPASGNPAFFPELLEEGLEPVEIEEVWLSLTKEANIILDVSEHWRTRIEALKKHKSQIGDPVLFEQKCFDRREALFGTGDHYYEQFRRISLRHS